MLQLRPSVPRHRHGPRIVVLGDLVLDVVLAPSEPIALGTDVSGRVTLVQGGSAATTARWLARLGARSSLIVAVGRDGIGRALVAAMEADLVTMRVVRVAGARTGRIGVLVSSGGERSFVTDRGAAYRLARDDLKPSWFAGVQALHIPVYSLLDGPLGDAGRRAVELAREARAAVSVDLASIGPLMANGRRAARELISNTAPDILFATASESEALLGAGQVERLLEFASIAVVKLGSKGATVLARTGYQHLRFEVATSPLAAADTTGAGDAFDAGFLVGWFTARGAGRSLSASLQRAALAGHRTAARHLSAPRPELRFG
jgi:sugar/nucleoside kinase (ribokinase family)